MLFCYRKYKSFWSPVKKFRSAHSLFRKYCSYSEDMSSDKVTRGVFVVLEGCDRCGKTTQSKLLVHSLKNRGLSAQFLQFPDRSTPVGSLISSYLQNKENLDDHTIHLLFSANRWELKDKILELLTKGVNVIVDRYSYSGVAFSAAKKGMTIDWCRQPETGLPAPDVVLFLDLSEKKVAERRQFGEERYEVPEFQKRVLKVYEKLKDDKWQTIDADKSIEDLQQQLLHIVEKTIMTYRNSSIKYLWDK